MGDEGQEDQLARGASLDDSVLAEVRNLIKNGERDKAVTVGHALRARPATRSMGCAVLGVALLNSSGPVSAWTVFSEIAGTAVSGPVARDVYAAAFGALGDDASAILDEDIASGRIRDWSGLALLRVAQKAMARELHDQATVLIRTAQDRPRKSMSKNVRKELARLATWLPGGPKRAEIPTVRGAINFGVIGYDQPDIVSRNIGDYIQTLAAMGHVVRQQNFSFTGDPDLVEFAAELRRSTRTDRLVDGESATFNLFELNRDGNTLQAVPERTWALTFGWFMHYMFDQGYALPFHDNVRPIIMSVHIRFPAILTPEAIEYLRRYSPVGCRDWQTVALLRSVGVPAFFSGCMTTTVDTVFRRDGEDTSDYLTADGAGTVPDAGADGDPGAVLRREPEARSRVGVPLPPGVRQGGHLEAALLPTSAIGRLAGHLPAEEPVRQPLRRLDRQHGRGLRSHASGHSGQGVGHAADHRLGRR